MSNNNNNSNDDKCTDEFVDDMQELFCPCCSGDSSVDVPLDKLELKDGPGVVGLDNIVIATDAKLTMATDSSTGDNFNIFRLGGKVNINPGDSIRVRRMHGVITIWVDRSFVGAEPLWIEANELPGIDFSCLFEGISGDGDIILNPSDDNGLPVGDGDVKIIPIEESEQLPDGGGVIVDHDDFVFPDEPNQIE